MHPRFGRGPDRFERCQGAGEAQAVSDSCGICLVFCGTWSRAELSHHPQVRRSSRLTGIDGSRSLFRTGERGASARCPEARRQGADAPRSPGDGLLEQTHSPEVPLSAVETKGISPGSRLGPARSDGRNDAHGP